MTGEKDPVRYPSLVTCWTPWNTVSTARQRYLLRHPTRRWSQDGESSTTEVGGDGRTGSLTEDPLRHETGRQS